MICLTNVLFFELFTLYCYLVYNKNLKTFCNNIFLEHYYRGRTLPYVARPHCEQGLNQIDASIIFEGNMAGDKA